MLKLKSNFGLWEFAAFSFQNGKSKLIWRKPLLRIGIYGFEEFTFANVNFNLKKATFGKTKAEWKNESSIQIGCSIEKKKKSFLQIGTSALRIQDFWIGILVGKGRSQLYKYEFQLPRIQFERNNFFL